MNVAESGPCADLHREVRADANHGALRGAARSVHANGHPFGGGFERLSRETPSAWQTGPFGVDLRQPAMHLRVRSCGPVPAFGQGPWVAPLGEWPGETPPRSCDKSGAGGLPVLRNRWGSAGNRAPSGVTEPARWKHGSLHPERDGRGLRTPTGLPSPGQTPIAATPPWCRSSNRQLHSAYASACVNASGHSSSDVVAFSHPTAPSGTVPRWDTEWSSGSSSVESAERHRQPSGRLSFGSGGAPRPSPSGLCDGPLPGAASAMSNQVASGTSPREHRADVCGNMHDPLRILRVLKALRSGDPPRRGDVPWQHGGNRDGVASNGERETTRGEHGKPW